jgi:hypothetical protein
VLWQFPAGQITFEASIKALRQDRGEVSGPILSLEASTDSWNGMAKLAHARDEEYYLKEAGGLDHVTGRAIGSNVHFHPVLPRRPKYFQGTNHLGKSQIWCQYLLINPFKKVNSLLAPHPIQSQNSPNFQSFRFLLYFTFLV